MNPHRLLAASLAALAVSILSPVLRADVRCASKPLAPIRVAVLEQARAGDAILLRVELKPLRVLDELRWWLESSNGLRRTGGDADGALSDAGGVRELHLELPRDGRFTEAELFVSGLLPGTDERVVATQRFTWGQVITGAQPRSTLRAGDGATITRAAVPTQQPATPRRQASSAEASSSFVVRGRFLFEDKGWGFNGWTGEDPLRSVRHADVTVIDAGAAVVLASGITEIDGSFELTCNASGPVDLVVRCDAAAFHEADFQAQQVVAPEGWTYAMFAPPVLDHDPAFDVDLGDTIALKLMAGSKEGNPFNVFDMSTAAFELLHAPPFGAAPLSERVIEHLWPAGPSSFAFVDGTSISDDDGYDDALILHEIGHVVQSLWSDFTGGGGTHTFGDSDQHPPLSLSEGFATFFGGQAQLSRGRPAQYVDSNGGVQTGGAQLRAVLETAQPYVNDARGIADELAVACALHDLADDVNALDSMPGVDDDPLDGSLLVDGGSATSAFWRVFSEPTSEGLDGTLNNVWDRWFELHTVEPQHAALASVFQNFGQDFTEDAAEPDDTQAQATLLPTLPLGGWTEARTLYRTDDASHAPGNGDVDWFAHELVVGSVMKFLTRYPNAANDADTQADTTVELFDPSGASVAFDFDSGPGRNGRVTDFTITETGTWTVRVARQDPVVRRYGRYEYRGQVLFENFAPQIDAGPTALPGVIRSDETAELSAVASDGNPGQALSYEWTPLDGGSIEGSSALVQFVPPTVERDTEVRVQLVVIDALGATSPAEVVSLVVRPAAVGACAEAASIASVGTGKAGALGVPLLSAVGVPTLPTTNLVLRVSGALPGATGTLVAGLARLDAPFDQGTLHPRPDVLLHVTADASGNLELAAPLMENAALCGLVVSVQALFPGDPGARGHLQTAQSNALDLGLGN